jgi:hypothetical protein
MAKFVIEDESHDEPQGEFATAGDALAELRRRAEIPWDHDPNRAPCQSWQTCGRRYELVEFDDRDTPRKELRRELVLEISADGIEWHRDSR